jgi:hypothetical protein
MVLLRTFLTWSSRFSRFRGRSPSVSSSNVVEPSQIIEHFQKSSSVLNFKDVTRFLAEFSR